MIVIKNNNKRASTIIFIFKVLFWIVVFEALMLLYFFIAPGLMTPSDTVLELEIGEEFSTAPATQFLLEASEMIALIETIISILAIIFFIRWFRRAYENLFAFPEATVAFKPGMASGSWFIPVLNLIRPFQIMKEIWEKTQELASHRLGTIQSPKIVTYWWTGWVLIIVLRIGIITMSLVSDFAQTGLVDQQMIFFTSMIVIPIILATLQLAIAMIRSTRTFEDALWQEAQAPSDSIFAANIIQPAEEKH